MNNSKPIASIFFGSILISIAINNFFVPFHILDGGMIGLGMILHYKYEVAVGLTTFIISIPIYIYAWLAYRQFFYNSIAGFTVSTLFIDLFSFITFDVTVISPLFASLFGGLLLGIGVGIMFVFDISTGGLDLFAQMVSDFTRINVGIVIFIIDILVVFAGMSVINFNEMVLSIIAVSSTGVSTTIIVMLKEHFLY